jgi:ubiquinone/menaquinone biosynthesis C-methylase UbiE
MVECLTTMLASYDEIADWYDGVLGGDLPLGGVSILELAGEVRGQRVCDLACGQGVIARHLARLGARVVGVDLSGKLLQIARRYEETEPLGIVYLRDDARALAAVRDAVFDGVVCSLALMDIPDLPAVLGAVQRILRPAGWFAFSVTHPCFQTPGAQWVRGADGALSREIRGYFAEGFWRSDYPNGVRGKVGAYHRTLSTYLNGLSDAGLVLERSIEPPATVSAIDPASGNLEVPKVLVARCRSGRPEADGKQV